MRRTFVVVVSLVLAVLVFSACSASKFSVTENEGKKVIVGNLNWEQWQDNAGWKTYTAPEYKPNTKKVSEIGDISNQKNISYLIFAGSWCSDSETELPKLFKLIVLSGVFIDMVHLYGLDREKHEPTGIAMPYNIEKVPTLIILMSDKEIGRIVETPKKSWDDDIITILRSIYYQEQ